MGYAAVKYADLKNQRLTNYKFSFDDMLSLKGNTAVYLLYAHARIAGIVRKSNKDVASEHSIFTLFPDAPIITFVYAIHDTVPKNENVSASEARAVTS